MVAKIFWCLIQLGPVKKKGEPKITNIRALKYTPDGNIKVKLNFKKEYFSLPQRKPTNNKSLSTFQPTHKERLKITTKKWKHLQELEEVVPQDCHAFYDQPSV